MNYIRSIGEDQITNQICDLVNTYDGWCRPFTPEEIKRADGFYIIESLGRLVLGCIGLISVHDIMMYTEIRHLRVHPLARRQGLGKLLLQEAIRSMPTEVGVAFIKEDNIVSLNMFLKEGFVVAKKLIREDAPNLWLVCIRRGR